MRGGISRQEQRAIAAPREPHRGHARDGRFSDAPFACKEKSSRVLVRNNARENIGIPVDELPLTNSDGGLGVTRLEFTPVEQ